MVRRRSKIASCRAENTEDVTFKRQFSDKATLRKFDAKVLTSERLANAKLTTRFERAVAVLGSRSTERQSFARLPQVLLYQILDRLSLRALLRLGQTCVDMAAVTDTFILTRQSAEDGSRAVDEEETERMQHEVILGQPKAVIRRLLTGAFQVNALHIFQLKRGEEHTVVLGEFALRRESALLRFRFGQWVWVNNAWPVGLFWLLMTAPGIGSRTEQKKWRGTTLHTIGLPLVNLFEGERLEVARLGSAARTIDEELLAVVSRSGMAKLAGIAADSLVDMLRSMTVPHLAVSIAEPFYVNRKATNRIVDKADIVQLDGKINMSATTVTTWLKTGNVDFKDGK